MNIRTYDALGNDLASAVLARADGDEIRARSIVAALDRDERKYAPEIFWQIAAALVKHGDAGLTPREILQRMIAQDPGVQLRDNQD